MQCQQLDVLDQSLHGRIIPVFFFELQFQALRKVACKYSNWIKTLQCENNPFQILLGHTQACRHFVSINAQISALIKAIDKLLRNQNVSRVGNGKTQLLL